MRRPQNLKKSPTCFNVYSVTSKQVEAFFFKFLWPFQKTSTLLILENNPPKFVSQIIIIQGHHILTQMCLYFFLRYLIITILAKFLVKSLVDRNLYCNFIKALALMWDGVASRTKILAVVIVTKPSVLSALSLYVLWWSHYPSG